MKFSKYSIPLIAAGLVLTARTDDTTSQPKNQASGAPGSSEGQTRQSQSSSEQQSQQLTEQQRNKQSTFKPGEVTDSELKKSVTEVNKASSFIGMGVKNMQNENLGKVHDLVFDPQKGRISYAVLSIGGVLGVGDKLIAVPVTSLRPQPGQNHLVLNMNKSQVQSAPGLAQNNWPDLDFEGIGGAAETETSAEESESSGAPASSTSSSDKSSSSSSTSQESSSTSISTPSSSASPTSPGSQSPQGSGPSSTSGQESSESSAPDSQGSSPGSVSGTSSSEASKSDSSSSIGSNSDASQSTSPDTERESNQPNSSKLE